MREHAEADPVGSEQVPEAAIGQTVEGSFSAVSKPNFASKHSLELGSIWKALAEIYTMHSFAPFSMLKILFKDR